MRIIFSPESYNLGETTRCIEVASAAVTRGHDVEFHVYAEKFVHLIEAAGHKVKRASPLMTQEQADQIIAFDQGRGFRHPFNLETVRSRVSAEVDSIRGADAVVIGSNPTMFISARAVGVPLYYVRPYYMSSSYFMANRDGHRASIPFCVLAYWLRWKPKSFRRVASEYGVQLPSRTFEAMSGDIDLIASLPPVLDKRSLECRDIAVGPIHYRPNIPLPDFLETRNGSRPLIYVSMGSSGSSKVLSVLLNHLSRMDYDVLLGGGIELSENFLKSLGGSIFYAGMVPEHRLRGKVDAAIIHGGEGTVQAMCLAGVPFAGYAMQAEQRWNIGECVRLGNARYLRNSDLNYNKFSVVVSELFNNKKMRDSATQISKQMNSFDGPLKAIMEIEKRQRSI